MLLALQPSQNAPLAVSMRQSKRYRLGAIFRNPVEVVLILFAHIGAGPGELLRTWVAIALQCQSSTPHHDQYELRRQPRMHFPQLLQIDVHIPESIGTETLAQVYSLSVFAWIRVHSRRIKKGPAYLPGPLVKLLTFLSSLRTSLLLRAFPLLSAPAPA